MDPEHRLSGRWMITSIVRHDDRRKLMACRLVHIPTPHTQLLTRGQRELEHISDFTPFFEADR
jgi:hypothetical protein